MVILDSDVTSVGPHLSSLSVLFRLVLPGLAELFALYHDLGRDLIDI